MDMTKSAKLCEGALLETLMCDPRCMVWKGITKETVGLVTSGIGPRSWGYPANSGHATLGRGSGNCGGVTPCSWSGELHRSCRYLTPGTRSARRLIMKTMHMGPRYRTWERCHPGTIEM